MKYKLNRTVTKEECNWLDGDIPEGTIVYRFYGATYGCIGPGIAVSYQEGQNPFFEMPYDSLDLVED